MYLTLIVVALFNLFKTCGIFTKQMHSDWNGLHAIQHSVNYIIVTWAVFEQCKP